MATCARRPRHPSVRARSYARTFAAIFQGRQCAAALVEGLALAIDRDTLAHVVPRSGEHDGACGAAASRTPSARGDCGRGPAARHRQTRDFSSLLQKPGPLEPDEFEQVKRHPVLVAQMLADSQTTRGAGVDRAASPRELERDRLPDGLAETTIPIGARVLAIIDCYDALTSDRPYRRALPRDRAVEMIEERSGTMYDPAIVLRVPRGGNPLVRLPQTVSGQKEPAA